MVTMRHLFGVRDARGEIPDARRLYGDLEGGGRVYLELGGKGKGPQVRRVPHKIRDDETGLSYVVEPGEGEALAEKIKACLEKRYGNSARIEASIQSVETGGDASVRVSLPVKLWPRFGAKLGLAFGREALDDDWLLSEDASRLRRVLGTLRTKWSFRRSGSRLTTMIPWLA